MKKILWTNPTKSGLCDRLQDLFLMSAYAYMHDSDLYLYWPQGSDDLNFNQFQLNTWPTSRWTDYFKENICLHFNLPSNIHFLPKKSSVSSEPVVHFNNYLGGVLSRKMFAEKYGLDKNSFYKFHNKALSEFTAKNKLINLVGENTQIDLSIHLRRTDKINTNPNHVEIHTQELKWLDDMTMKCVLDQIKESHKKLNIYVCSDCPESKNEYIDKLSSKCNIIQAPNTNHDCEQTYIDLHLLSKSQKVIMSQKHSNFSYFASSINESELLYFYSDNELISGSDSNRFKIFHGEAQCLL